MAHVVTERCVDCRYTDCCTVCPVECFYEITSPAMLVIDPNTCIDCGLCVEECPIRAIWPEADVPPEYHEWIAKNAELYSSGTMIKIKKDPLPGALTLAQIQARERERGWTITEPSAPPPAEGHAPAAPAARAEAGAEPTSAPPSQAAATATADAGPPPPAPRPLPEAQRIAAPAGLTATQARIFDATANTTYHWRTVGSLARQLGLSADEVQRELEALIQMGHLRRQPPRTRGSEVYAAAQRRAS